MSKVNLEYIKSLIPLIRSYFPATPLYGSHLFSELTGLSVSIKWDNVLRTGSFKERGAISALSKLTAKEKEVGIVAASAGNHAMALARYSKILGISCQIVMPKWASLIKISKTKELGAQVILEGNNFQEAYQHALTLSEESKRIFISAYDNDDIICGQGTLGLELLDQAKDFDSVIVPIGGGGLISGVATAIKSVKPEVKIIGVQSEWIVNQRQNATINNLPLRPTSIADGIAVKSIGKRNQPIIDKLVDEIVVVSEEQIADAIIKLLEFEKTIVEGAGAASIAALTCNLIKTSIKKPIAVVCGSNIDMDVVCRLIMRNMSQNGRHIRIKMSVPDRPGTLSYITTLLAENGANVLEVNLNRSFANAPGDVEISIAFEVRDNEHKESILNALKKIKIQFELIK